MTQPFFPCTISAQSRNNEFLTIKTVVRKTHQNNGHTGSSCLDKAVLAQGGGGGKMMDQSLWTCKSLYLLLCPLISLLSPLVYKGAAVAWALPLHQRKKHTRRSVRMKYEEKPPIWASTRLMDTSPTLTQPG